MAWLKQAVAAGFNDVAHLEKDTDLGPVRPPTTTSESLTSTR